MDFKEKLQILRTQMKLSQEELAAQLNISRQSVTKWENGQSFPDYSRYKDIYCKKDLGYWRQLSDDIDDYCAQKEINYTNYFYHSLLVSEKKGK